MPSQVRVIDGSIAKSRSLVAFIGILIGSLLTLALFPFVNCWRYVGSGITIWSVGDFMKSIDRKKRAIVVVAGVEGVGHHMFHDSIWPLIATANERVLHDHSQFYFDTRKKCKSLSALQLHQLFLDRPQFDFREMHPGAKVSMAQERLDCLGDDQPTCRTLLADYPSYPCSPLEYPPRLPYHNPDLVSLSRGAVTSRTKWTLLTIVLVRSWPHVFRANFKRGFGVKAENATLQNVAATMQVAMQELETQVRSLETPWVVLPYESMGSNLSGCVRALSVFLDLPVESVSRAMGEVKMDLFKKAGWSEEQMEWIQGTFGPEEAMRRWPTIETMRRNKPLC